MLASWTAITDAPSLNDPTTATSSSPRGTKRSLVESNEAKEGRLRSAYEKALISIADGDEDVAKETLLDISAELDEPLKPSRKRARVRGPSEDEQVGWVRALRHAVNRNLGDIQMVDGEPLDALESYAKALDDDNSAFVVWMRAARAAGETGRLHVARRAYEAALKIRPDHPLCRKSYRVVLRAIGDEDEDIATVENDDDNVHTIVRLLDNRERNGLLERERELEDLEIEGRITLKEGRWKPLIDALGVALSTRLGREGEASIVPVGWPVEVLVQGHLGAGINVVLSENREDASDSAVDTEKEMQRNIVEAATPETAPTDADNQTALLTGETHDKVPVNAAETNKSGSTLAPISPNATAPASAPAPAPAPTPAPAPDPRKSLRLRGEEPTGQQAEVDDGFLDEMNTLLRLSRSKNFEDCIVIEDDSNGEKITDSGCINLAPENGLPKSPGARESTWTVGMSDDEELKEVIAFCVELNASNSGPLDALQRVVLFLAEKESSQYLSEIAQAWLSLRKYGIINAPGNVRVSLCVVEGLLVSALKVRKGKAQKYEEAERLLSMASITIVEYAGASKADLLSLQLRCAWLYSHINEKNDDLPEAFKFAGDGLTIARCFLEIGADKLTEISGPEFASRDTKSVIDQLDACVKRLKRSSELQKATKEISSAKSGDTTRASNALGLLAPSIRDSVRILKLGTWKKGEAESAVQEKTGVCNPSVIDEKEELEKRLKVFGEACRKSDDAVGGVLSGSIRLRLLIIAYWASVNKERTSSSKKRFGDSLDSSGNKLGEIVAGIRQYAANIKTMVSSIQQAHESPTIEKTGWSLVEVLEIAIYNLITVCELLSKMISTLGKTQAASNLQSTQKNQRLAFTRCMLAFTRCIEMRMKLEEDISVVPANKMLTVICFCLHSLANRGCCREEGTAGALIRLYLINLNRRLQELVKNASPIPKSTPKGAGGIEIVDLSLDDDGGIVDVDLSSSSASAKMTMFSLNYKWDDIKLVRQQLAQCYRCMYKLADFETSNYFGHEAAVLQWLEDGCNASKALGLTFISGEVASSVPKMNPEICRAIYFMYRKRLMVNFVNHRMDGVRGKSSREIIQEIVSFLPDNPPADVSALQFDTLDEVVSAAVAAKTLTKKTCEQSVTHMREKWSQAKKAALEKNRPNVTEADKLQSSIIYFECYVLNAIGMLALYDSEFKKNRNVSRRKGAKEFVDKLNNAASDCVTALRLRPWSIGAWILLGRIFVELADVALDEREMLLSTFGVYQPEELMGGDPDESAEGIIKRAEVCFGLAEVLIGSTWSNEECTYKPDISAAEVYCEAQENENDTEWCGFGDDGDLFGTYGLNNNTTCRPWLADEDHPRKNLQPANERLKAAICFGRSALLALRAREDRYWYSHWNLSIFKQSDLTRKERPLSRNVKEVLKAEMNYLEEGLRLVASGGSIEIDVDAPKWRADPEVFRKQTWYYLLRRGKLKRKLGEPPAEYLKDFSDALKENMNLRNMSKQSADIEVLYQLHAVRAKVLMNPATGHDEQVLRTLATYSFSPELAVSLSTISNVEQLRNALGVDILNAMKSCGGKSGQSYTEHYFKSVYYRTVIYRDVLSSSQQALAAVTPCFRGDAAAKVIEPNSDGSHRGYFYLIWNYRLTDTGSEPTLESERKCVRWRIKLLSMYGRLLRETEQRKIFAGIISRLKRRATDDLPVDGALLDEFILAYAEITRRKILTTAVSSERDCELSFRQTWDVFVETLRLVQGVRRLHTFVERGQPAGVQPKRLLASKRPWCQVPIANTLHLERLRWLAVSTNSVFDIAAASELPFEGSLEDCSGSALGRYADTMQHCGERWKIGIKLDKLLWRRVDKYRKLSNSTTRGSGSPTANRRNNVNSEAESVVNTPARKG